MIRQILISLAVTTVVSSIFSYTLNNFFGGWVHAFVFAFLAQVLGHYFYNDVKIRNDNIKQNELETERLDILSRNNVTFQCPCGNKEFNEVVYIAQDNIFECDKCNQLIKADINITPTVVTIPLLVDPLTKLMKQVDKL